MQTVIQGLRSVLGAPELYVDGVLDYGHAIEYMIGGILVCIVVSSVFKILIRWFE